MLGRGFKPRRESDVAVIAAHERYTFGLVREAISFEVLGLILLYQQIGPTNHAETIPRRRGSRGGSYLASARAVQTDLTGAWEITASNKSYSGTLTLSASQEISGRIPMVAPGSHEFNHASRVSWD
jgi:hypothetical protein